MKLLTATLRLYLESATDAARAFTRSAWALGVLIASFPVLLLASMLLGQIPVLGGILLALLTDAAAGTYLACLQDALTLRRPLSWAAVRGNLGSYTWDIVNVQFPLWILHFLLAGAQVPAVAILVVDVALFLFLNPLPEMIGRARSGGFDTLKEAATFTTNHGPEWFIGQLPIFAGLGLWVGWTAALQFGPMFGFVNSGAWILGRLTMGGRAVAEGFALVALIHLLMLFRGALYQRLGQSGRRSRAWQENFR